MPEQENTQALGQQGKRGEQGLQGVPGKDGRDGRDGAVGPKGEQGPQGPAGDVSEEVLMQAIANDPTLKGEKGDKGDPGPHGPNGRDGVNGKDGVGLLATFSPDGTILTISREDGTHKDSRELRGAMGDPGAKGDTGPKGDKGEPGEVGPKGEEGVRGETGLRGLKGDTGATGAKGDTGLKGDKGDTGSQGDSHVKVRRRVSIPAQSAQSKYTAPAINLGANVFTNTPVVSADIESSATNVVLTVQFVVGGNAATGFTVTPTIAAMNTTVSILILGSVNLLGSIPACTLHITASEPS